MKTYSGLALAAALAAAGAVYTGLPASATPPPPDDRPALPPLVLDPGAKLPAPAPADMVKPVEKAGPPAKVELPPLPPVSPAPLPVPMPILPAAKAEPTKLPTVPPPPVAQPLPSVPPPVAQPKLPVVPPPPVIAPPAPLPTSAPLPVVPPPVSAAPKAQPLPVVPPPVVEAPKVNPLPAPRVEVQQPQPLPPPLPVTPATPPAVGSVVVLQDGKVVEGHVSYAGEKVVVRRGVIDQPFPKEQVKYITPDKDAAYRAALKDTKLDDPAARLRLARWCMYNGMRENALTEAKEAVRLEPANRTAAELARTLEESLRLYPGDGTTRATPPAVQPAAPGLPAVPPPVSVTPPAPPVVTVPEPDMAPEAVVAFGPRVQPVLMNQCASCHAKTEHAGAFRLAPVATNETNPAATRANLAAAARQLTKADPGASPLLVKATTAHGGQTAAALTDREAASFRVLHAWAYLAAGELVPPVAAAPPNPTLPPAPVSPTLPPPPAATVPPMLLPAPTLPAPPPIPPAVGSLPALPTAPAPSPVVPPIPPATGAPGFGQSAPPPLPTGPAQDEFDPANFNRPLPRR